MELAEATSPPLLRDELCDGTCWYELRKIYLSKDLNTSTAKRTIRHELVHAFIYTTQANRPKEWNEEAICDFFGIYGKQISDLGEQIYNALYN